MIKVTGIIKHGKNVAFVKLIGEIIECPECGTVGVAMDKCFKPMKASGNDFFSIICNKCECEFMIRVKGTK